MSLLKIWKNRNQILEGIRNNIFKKEHIEEIAQERMTICNDCTSIGTNCVAPGTEPCCGECGCSLKFKVRALSANCPLDKWKAILTEEEEDLLNSNLNRHD